MTYALTLVAASAAGLSVLRLLRLDTRVPAVDLAVAWFVGQGWFALTALVCRFLLRVPFSRGLVLAIALVPVAAWLVSRRVRAATATTDRESEAPRWRPRPTWIWGPAVAYVALIVVATVVHGFNTPTSTDDAVRVRAFTPMLAFGDAWSDKARELLMMAGAVPTFVPALSWALSGTLDHFHVNYVVLTDLVAVVVAAVGLASSRGSPERGWATAVGLTSIPLFVYHCTSTYQDAVLAMFVGAAFLFAMEWMRARTAADFARAMLLLVAAAMVKREGELVAGSIAAVLVAVAAWDRWRGRRDPVGRPALLALVLFATMLVTKVVAAGAAAAFPFLGILATRAEGGGIGGQSPTAQLYAAAAGAFVDALFRSGNAGGIYWILLATVAVRVRTLGRRWLGASFLVVLVLLVEAAISAVWMVPEYTVNMTTVHRSLLVVTVPAAIWAAAAWVDAVWPGAELPTAG